MRSTSAGESKPGRESASSMLGHKTSNGPSRRSAQSSPTYPQQRLPSWVCCIRQFRSDNGHGVIAMGLRHQARI